MPTVAAPLTGGSQAERSTGHVAGRRETLSLTQVIKDMIDRDGGGGGGKARLH
jgi:hypothetical protein